MADTRIDVVVHVDMDPPPSAVEVEELLGDALTGLPGEGKVSLRIMALLHDGRIQDLGKHRTVAVR